MANEAGFRRWLISVAPKDALIQSIETSTGSGVPDIFLCIKGSLCWVELKDAEGGQCYMRVSQWLWMRRLLKAGGTGFLMIRHKAYKTIDIYDMAILARQQVDFDAKVVRQDIFFSKSTKPVFSHTLGTGNKLLFEKLLEYLERRKV